MNKFFSPISIFFVLALLGSLLGGQVAQARPGLAFAPEAGSFEGVLGKSLSDEEVADFLYNNDCIAAGQFQLCEEVGLALWTAGGEVVDAVYLYPNGSGDFDAFKGKLPFGLAADDTMATVENKLGSLMEFHAPLAGWSAGLPDGGGTPDHMHYHAIYDRFGFTVIYNSPSALDKNATIHAVLVTK